MNYLLAKTKAKGRSSRFQKNLQFAGLNCKAESKQVKTSLPCMCDMVCVGHDRSLQIAEEMEYTKSVLSASSSSPGGHEVKPA